MSQIAPAYGVFIFTNTDSMGEIEV